MHRVATERADRLDLLDRAPATGRPCDNRRSAPFVDPAQQILGLLHLVDEGLLSTEEFERQRRKVLEP